jgi:hypothetical protein
MTTPAALFWIIAGVVLGYIIADIYRVWRRGRR